MDDFLDEIFGGEPPEPVKAPKPERKRLATKVSPGPPPEKKQLATKAAKPAIKESSIPAVDAEAPTIDVKASVVDTKAPAVIVKAATQKPKRQDARLVSLKLGEIFIPWVESTEMNDMTVAPAEAKKILQSDEHSVGKRRVKLTRRVSTSVDSRIYTFVCFDQWGSATPDMGFVKLPIFALEVERFRNCGPSALRYII